MHIYDPLTNRLRPITASDSMQIATVFDKEPTMPLKWYDSDGRPSPQYYYITKQHGKGAADKILLYATEEDAVQELEDIVEAMQRKEAVYICRRNVPIPERA